MSNYENVMKISTYYTAHFYNNSALRIYNAGEPMLEKPKRASKVTAPAFVLSVSLVKRMKKT
jgi:hypothetical protein